MDNILNNSLLFYYDNTCIYSKKLLQKLKEINKKSNNKIYLEAIKKAITFIRRYHAGQMRKSGEPFYSHYKKGNALSMLNKNIESIECYDMAIKFKPDYVDAYYNKGYILNKLGKYQARVCPNDCVNSKIQ